MQIDSDVIDGARLTRTKDGDSFTRVLHITGLTGSGDQRLITALSFAGFAHLDTKTIRHPTSKTSVATRADVVASGVDGARVTVTYEPEGKAKPPPGEEQFLEITTSIVSARTNLDKDGNLITVEYTDSTGLRHTQVGEVEKMIPQTVACVSFTRNDSPLEDSKKYVGTVSNGGILGGAERTWLCTRWGGRTVDWGKTWRGQADFQYANHSRWDVQVAYVSPETGEVPSNVDASNGLKTVQVYKEEKFPF